MGGAVELADDVCWQQEPAFEQPQPAGPVLAEQGGGPARVRRSAKPKPRTPRSSPSGAPAWMTGFLSDAHVHSVTGQAPTTSPAPTTSSATPAPARLSAAIAGHGDGRARAVALCSNRLATLHPYGGHLPEGRAAARTALQAAPGLRSAHISRDLNTVYTAAGLHPADDALRQISDQITDSLTTVG